MNKKDTIYYCLDKVVRKKYCNIIIFKIIYNNISFKLKYKLDESAIFGITEFYMLCFEGALYGMFDDILSELNKIQQLQLFESCE